MLVIVSMFILLVVVLALVGGGLYWWSNRDDIDLPATMQKLKPGGKAGARGDSHSLSKRSSMLGTNEIACFAALLKVAGDKARVIPKVRLAELIRLDRDQDDDSQEARLLASRCVDFVLVNPKTLAPMAAVNVERKPKRDERGEIVESHKPRTDVFSEDALRVVGIPLLKLVAKDQYDPVDVSRRIKLVMAGNTTEQDAEIDIVPTQAPDGRAGGRLQSMASRVKGGLPRLGLRRG